MVLKEEMWIVFEWVGGTGQEQFIIGTKKHSQMKNSDIQEIYQTVRAFSTPKRQGLYQPAKEAKSFRVMSGILRLKDEDRQPDFEKITRTGYV